MLLILSVIILVLSFVYLKLKYFTLRGPIPGLSPQFLVGNLVQTGFTSGASYSSIFSSLRKRFGDIYQVWLGPERCIVICNIKDVQYIFTNRNIYDQGAIFVEKLSLLVPDGIIVVKGAKFKRHGAVSMPLFRRAKIIPNFDLILDWTDKQLDKWRAQPKGLIHTDIVQQCQGLLLEIFGFIAFDFDLGAFADHTHKKHKNELNEALESILDVMNIVFYAPKIFGKTYLKLNLRYRQARATVEKYLHRMIEQELGESEESRAQRKRTSLIASFVASLQQDEKAEANKREEDKRGLSRTEILDEMITFLIAGFETTSTALSWFIYAMSKHPHVQRKLKAEVKGEDGRYDLTVERFDSFVYLDCVISEIFRYYTPTEFVMRTVVTDDRLPDSGTQLFTGDKLIIPTCVLGKDSQLWSIDPERFYPERFLTDDKNHNSYAFLPFGAGHRQCIGQDLARFEFKAIAARLMQYVTFGDGGPEINAGGHLEGLTSKPKKVGVTIDFDGDQ